MKTNCSPKLLGCRLIGVLALLLFSFVVEGQTYRLLKAGNDNSAAVDRDEVSKVLSPTNELNDFLQLRSTSNVIGFSNDQEYNLSEKSGISQRAHTNTIHFKELGLSWMNSNPGLEMVVLDVANTDELNNISRAVSILLLTHSVRYLIIQTLPELYPTSLSSEYENKGLELIVPAISNQLNALYDIGVRVFFIAKNPS